MLVERFFAWAQSVCVEDRAEAVLDLARAYDDAGKDAAERSLYEQLFTRLLDETDPKVRGALADGLARCAHTPRTLVWSLAQDIPSVSKPVLENSPVLDGPTLIDIVKSRGGASAAAIAARSNLDADVARAIALESGAASVIALLENPAVTLGPKLLQIIADRLGDDATIRAILLADDDLAPTTRQTLMAGLSKALNTFVVTSGWLENDLSSDAVCDAKNRASIAIANCIHGENMPEFAKHMLQTDQLTPALLIRAICSGNAAFFETALSQLSGMSLKRVQSIVDEGRPTAFLSLYKRSGLPNSARSVFAAAISVWQEIGCAQTSDAGRAMLGAHAVEAILDRAEQDDGTDPVLLSLLRRLVVESARESAHEAQPLLTAA